MRTLCLLALVSVGLFAERVSKAKIQLTPELLGLPPELAPSPIPVWDLAYSPDGTMLAIGAGMYSTSSHSGIVLIVSAPQPDVVLHRFEVFRLQVLEDYQAAIQWMPESDALTVGSFLLDLKDSSKVRLPNWGEIPQGFLSNRRVVTSRSTTSNGRQIEFNLRSIAGGVEASWVRPWLASAARVSVLRDRIPLCQWRTGPASVHDSFCEMNVVDTEGRTAWQARLAPITFSIAGFADDYRQVCAGKYRGYRTPMVFACWNSETGEQTAQLDEVGMSYGTFSAGGTRVAVNDFEVTPCPWCEILNGEAFTSAFRHRAVWDFRTNRRLASWIPETQRVQESWERVPRQLRFRFALSPDGNSLVEGGAGVVQIYDIVADPE